MYVLGYVWNNLWIVFRYFWDTFGICFGYFGGIRLVYLLENLWILLVILGFGSGTLSDTLGDTRNVGVVL